MKQKQKLRVPLSLIDKHSPKTQHFQPTTNDDSAEGPILDRDSFTEQHSGSNCSTPSVPVQLQLRKVLPPSSGQPKQPASPLNLQNQR